jgi:hypothetical protein
MSLNQNSLGSASRRISTEGRKTKKYLFSVFMWTDLSLGLITMREERRNKKENVLNQNSLGSASRRTSTERRKTKKNLLVNLCGLTFP